MHVEVRRIRLANYTMIRLQDMPLAHDLQRPNERSYNQETCFLPTLKYHCQKQ